MNRHPLFTPPEDRSDAETAAVEAELARFEIFASVCSTYEPHVLNTIARKVFAIGYGKHEVVVNKGDRMAGMYLVAKGAVGVYYQAWQQYD